MGYTLVKNRGADFFVHWEGVRGLIRSYRLAEAQWNRSSVVSMSDSSLFNPFSWGMPSVFTVDCDWEAVNRDVAQSVASDMHKYREWSAYDMPGVASDCKNRLSQTANYQRQFKNQLREAQQKTVYEMKSSVNDYEGAIEITEFIQNTSADILLMGSTVLAGPAALALLGGGSALTGIATYQDTGSVGAAVIKGSGSLVLGAFKVSGKNLTSAGEYALIVVQGGVETGTALASGKTFSESVKNGTLKVAGDAVSHHIMQSGFIKSGFDRLALPVRITDTHFTPPKNITQNTANSFTANVAQQSSAVALNEAFADRSAEQQGNTSYLARQPSTGFIASVPFEKELFLYFAIINLKKGIGHGW